MRKGDGGETVKEPERPLPHGWQIRVVGRSGPMIYPLPKGRELIVGRVDSADIVIDEPAISRRHLSICREEEVFVEDLGSANGTRVGDRVLQPGQKVRVWPGEIIDIGS